MIKVLLADDDFLVRTFLSRITDWEKHGYTLVGAAQDGEEALRMAKEYEPDIIITDIPSGNLVSWEGASESPLNLMYRQLAKMSHEDTILAVIMDKKQKPEANGWLRLEKQQLGKRKFEIYRCLNN